MKKPESLEDMTARLTEAATTPALTITKAQPAEAKAKAQPKAPKEPAKKGRLASEGGKSVGIYLTLPPHKWAELDAEKVKRMKATGQAVTVQQIILERI